MSGFLKFISPLVHPVGFTWLLLVLATLACVRYRRWLGVAIGGLASLGIWLLAQPRIMLPLLGGLERPWLSHTLNQAPASADAILVLGGGWRHSYSDFLGLDLTPSADRWIAGVELGRRGISTNLVVGGDPIHSPPGVAPDSERLREWLRLWGFRGLQLHTLGPVRSTRDEAVNAKALVDRMGWKRLILVTSALHMRRSIATFERAGVTVEPVACDFQVERWSEAPIPWRPFPDEDAFATFGLWWHEQLGWMAYRLFGLL